MFGLLMMPDVQDAPISAACWAAAVLVGLGGDGDFMWSLLGPYPAAVVAKHPVDQAIPPAVDTHPQVSFVEEAKMFEDADAPLVLGSRHSRYTHPAREKGAEDRPQQAPCKKAWVADRACQMGLVP